MMKKSNKKGFTLVELIVVIAIMAILAAVLVPTVTSKIKDANESAAKSDMSAIANTIQSDLVSINAGITGNLTILDANGAVLSSYAKPDKVTITKVEGKGYNITHSDYADIVYTVTLKGVVSGPDATVLA